MKTKKLIPLLTVAIALLLGATGCHHKAYVTRLPEPGVATPPPGDQIPPGQMVPPDNGTPIGTGGGATAPLEDFEGMAQDRGPLAANTVHFDFDSSVIKKGERSNVEAVANYFKSDATDKLLIEGHCDERGTEEYNRSLGERRALALREALAKLGMDPDRIRTISYGEDKPVDPGHNEDAWKKNRRGEFVVLHPK